jgi:hypothetical protein
VSGQPSLFDEPAPTTPSPAPWTEGGRHGLAMTEVVDSAGNAVATVWTHERPDVLPRDRTGAAREDYKPTARGRANLALILAAPKMLAALAGCVAAMARFSGGASGEERDALRAAREAIAATLPRPDHGFIGDGTWRCLACGQPKDAHPAAVPPEPGR